MRKLFVPFVALAATALVFTSCGDDTVAPEIKLPADALIVDLGDETAALKDVTAEDKKDGNVTSSLKVEGLDYVGKGHLVYVVADEANNVAKETRKDATVRCDKLKGAYSNTYTDPSDSKEYTDQVTIEEDKADPTILRVIGFYGDNSKIAEFQGDGKSMTMTMKQLDMTGGMYFTGTLTYTKSGTAYKVSTCNVTLHYSGGIEPDQVVMIFK